MQIMKNLVCSALLIIGMSAAHAVPLHWTLDSVLFSNGSTATGSFNYDASTHVYSSLLIQAAGHTLTTDELDPLTFGVDSTGIELVDGYVLNSNVGKFLLNLDFIGSLTNAGGIVNLASGFPSMEGTCSAFDCSSGSITAELTAGRLIGTSVPEPGSLALVSLALVGLAAARRKK